MDTRESFVDSLIPNQNSRILELGPLNRPIVRKEEFPNCRYCDIRSTEDVKRLYSGNAYLETTGIYIDPESVVEIDDVIEGGYAQFYKDKEKFDVVIASHVLEHMEDIIFSLRDIAEILKPGGVFCIAYPDRRYCFDHFRTSATFREAFRVFQDGVVNNAPMVLDFFLSAITENDPCRFWQEEKLEELLPQRDVRQALTFYQEALNGKKMEDVHYWPFSDWEFLLFLRECTRLQLLPYRCIEFVPTQENEQQFFIALEHDSRVLQDPKDAVKNLDRMLERALPHFYSAVEHRAPEEVQKQLAQKNEELAQQRKTILDMQKETQRHGEYMQELQATITAKDNDIAALVSQLDEMHAVIIQKDEAMEGNVAFIQQLQNVITAKDLDITSLVSAMDGMKAAIGQKDTEAEEAAVVIEQLQRRMEAHDSDIRKLTLHTNTLEETVAQKEQTIADRDAQIIELNELIKKQEEELAHKTQTLEKIEHSFIWRMSAPLRTLIETVKCKLRGEQGDEE